MKVRKALLASTAVLGSTLAVGPAFAADGIKLSVGGFFREAYMVVFDDDSEGELGNEANTDGFFNDAEIHFKGETTLDNGLTVGARVELEAETAGDQIDEAWISFAGGFGEVRIGSQDDALENGCIIPPGGTVNFSAFSPNQWGANVAGVSAAAGGFSSNSVCTGVDDKGDAQKIRYVTPVFGGFQLAVSYTPNGGDETHGDGVGPHTGMPINADEESRHNMAVYATYTYEGADWNLTWGGGGSFEGHVERSTGPDREESQFYQTGLNLSFGNFAIGGVFEYFNDFLSFDSGGQDLDIWVAGGGVAYTMDALTVGLQYSHRSDDIENSTVGFDEYSADRFALIGDYAIGPGLNIDGQVAYTTIDTDGELPDGVDDYDGFEIGIGTNFTF